MAEEAAAALEVAACRSHGWCCWPSDAVSGRHDDIALDQQRPLRAGQASGKQGLAGPPLEVLNHLHVIEAIGLA